MTAGRLDDDEFVYRRIPRAPSWFEEPDRLASSNFKLSAGELGVSVYRAAIVSPQQVLEKPGAIPDSLIAEARIGDIRALMDVSGTPYGLDVIPIDDEDDPGHAEIRAPAPGKLTKGMSKKLRDVFRPLL